MVADKYKRATPTGPGENRMMKTPKGKRNPGFPGLPLDVAALELELADGGVVAENLNHLTLSSILIGPDSLHYLRRLALVICVLYEAQTDTGAVVGIDGLHDVINLPGFVAFLAYHCEHSPTPITSSHFTEGKRREEYEVFSCISHSIRSTSPNQCEVQRVKFQHAPCTPEERM